MFWYNMKSWIYDHWQEFCLWLIKKSFGYKDNRLSTRLHRLADHYDTRPTGQWE